MYYSSEMPRVVGEFDADAVNHTLSQLSDHHGAHSLEMAKLKSVGLGCETCPDYYDLRQVSWLDGFNPRYLNWVRSDRSINFRIEEYEGIEEPSRADAWHNDFELSGLRRLPETLLGASRWPTIFLVGKLGVSIEDIMANNSSAFWGSNRGRELINDAVQKGNVHEEIFSEGEVVLANPGTIHRRNIPEGAYGLRFLIKSHPKRFSLIHSGSKLGRVSLLK